MVDSLTYLADDPETKIIVIHMEGIKRGSDFLKLVSQVTLNKPVIVFKSGRSQAGAKAALFLIPVQWSEKTMSLMLSVNGPE